MNQTITAEVPAKAHSPGPVPFGLKAGRMVRVEEVPKGLACGCVCPACGHVLVAKAKHSRHRRPHFAHYRDADCRIGFETTVHKAAKQLIADRLHLYLPAWDGDLDMPNPPVQQDDAGFCHLGRLVDYPAVRVPLVTAYLERARGDYIPDVTARDAQGELLIEIRVSHAVDDLKRHRVQSEGVRMMEIDLSRLTLAQALEPLVFEREVLENPANRSWISCPAATDAWRVSRDELRVHVQQVNKEIAAARQQEAHELARQQAARAVEQAKQATKAKNREIYREQRRRPYLQELAALPGLVAPGAIQSRLAAFEARDRDAIAEGLGAVASERLRVVMSYYHPNAWVYGAHPVLWQLGVYKEFVEGRPSGYRFNQRDVARWVRDQYGVEDCLYRLFLAQYKARTEARAGGFRKKRISAWFFSEQENLAIPNFYGPVGALIMKLVHIGLLKIRLDEIGGMERA